MSTSQQRYCTICAVLVIGAFVALGLYLDPSGVSRLNPFGSEQCESKRYSEGAGNQNSLGQPVPGSEDAKRSAPTQGAQKSAGQPENEDNTAADIYACRLAVYTHQLAIFTFTLAVATTALIGIGIWQGIHIRRSVDTARDEFNATHRPALLVRSVRVMFEGISQNPIGQRLIVQFELVNAGATKAQVLATSMSIDFLKGGILQMLRAPRVGEFAMPDHRDMELAAGEFRDCWYGNPEARYTDDMFRPYSSAEGLFFCGHIIYRGNDNAIRRTTFCRRYDAGRGYWPASAYYDYDHFD